MSIFISYRRNETQHIADRIYDRLLVEFGRECVFKDVNAIPLGTDFRDEIRAAVGRCDCLLVVIGPKWSTAVDDKGSRRLEDPLDFVRAEIEAALERKVPIIPLLVDDAKMPRVQDLPAKIQALAYRNGMPVRPDPDFDHDMARLTGALRRLTRVRGAWRRSPWVKLAAGVVCALGIALLVWFNLPKRAPVDSGKDPMNDTGRATGRDPTGEEQT
ncbi:MAG: toll/interleukin-1 receptor domain-containing protein, partial [Planctomycetaceae bacterium]